MSIERVLRLFFAIIALTTICGCAGASHGVQSRASENRLAQAAKQGDLPEVERLIAKGTNVNAEADNGDTALMLASQNGHKEIVKLLLDKGADVRRADVNAKLFGDITPLSVASDNGHKEIVELLLAKGADINAKDKNGNTALMMTITSSKSSIGSTEIIEFLLSKGADINAKDKNGNTALIFACERCDLKKVQVLLANGADVNAQNNNGYPVLMAAKTREIQMLLIKAGAQRPVLKTSGRTICGERNIEEAYKSMICEGKPDSESVLIDTLYECGDVKIAQYAVNSGNGKLELAAEKWAWVHNIPIQYVPVKEMGNVRWHGTYK